MPFRAFTKLMQCGTIYTEDNKPLDLKSNKLKEMRSKLNEWTQSKNPFFLGMIHNRFVGDIF